jgi:nitroimidazol reductase NimA-like FMN-containing flavoprotein (pyridoxamine 5'-phosphate oxidase superfamily)
MRRKRQQLTDAQSRQILTDMTAGVLAVAGDDDYPYAVPLSYVLDGDRILFHSALSGHKIDALHRSSKASFCVIEKNEIHPETYTTYFRSVIAFGTLRILTDEKEALEAIDLLAAKYAPGRLDSRRKEIEKGFRHMCMIELHITHLTGKESIEFVRAKSTPTV